MARPHAASIVEDAWHRRVDSLLRRRGWKTRVVAHTGYGSEEFARVLGRVLLTRRLAVTAITALVVVLLPETEPSIALAVAAAGVLVLIVVERDPTASLQHQHAVHAGAGD